MEIPLSAKFIKGHYYLVKLDYEEINRFGKIFFKYGQFESNKYENSQVYLIFKADDISKLNLLVQANDVFDYKINIKHILLIDITTMKLLQEDIAYLPFI